jgi:hypothetical protein
MRRAIQRILEDAISDAVVKNFLMEGDSATFGRKPAIEDRENLIVTVERERDGEVLEILIDESSRDFGTSQEDEEDEEAENSSSMSTSVLDSTNGDVRKDNEYAVLESQA